MQIKSTYGVGTVGGVKMLTYAKSGRGKTYLCSTAPNPFILSAESGLLALSNWQLPYGEIRTIEDLQSAYAWAKDSKEARQFETLCLDSLTEIADIILANAKIKNKDPRAAYGELIDKTSKEIRAFRDLPRWHVYMTAKQEAVKDESTGIIMNGPAMPGKQLGPALPYFFDEVFHLDVGKNPTDGSSYRYLRTQPDYANDAKDRSGRLDTIEAPDLANIIRKITAQQ